MHVCTQRILITPTQIILSYIPYFLVGIAVTVSLVNWWLVLLVQACLLLLAGWLLVTVGCSSSLCLWVDWRVVVAMVVWWEGGWGSAERMSSIRTRASSILLVMCSWDWDLHHIQVHSVHLYHQYHYIHTLEKGWKVVYLLTTLLYLQSSKVPTV